jgi:hypothetical protein
MKRLIFVLIVALAFAESLPAQNRKIEISYEKDRMGIILPKIQTTG